MPEPSPETAPAGDAPVAEIAAQPTPTGAPDLLGDGGETTPPEPMFDEIWSPAPRPRHQPRRTRESAPAGETASNTASEQQRVGPRRPKRKRQAPGKDGKNANDARPRTGKPHPDSPNGDNRQHPPQRQRPEPRIDPDSPFAALAALKDELAQRK
jgi:ATP-dependent RNA helicase SUPV3L1/SUV3